MAQTSLNSTGVASSGALSLQSNGTTEAIGISTGQVATLAQNPILTSGTANGVAYLNGSKVLTTGSALVFDGSNLGLGVTPSAWASAWKVLQISSSSFSNNGFDDTYLGANWRFDGTSDKYINSSFATLYAQVNGQHQWLTAPSGTAGNAISFTQAMTLNATGALLIACTAVPTNGVDGAWISAPTAGSGIVLGASSTSTIQMIRFYNPNGNIGGISTSGSLTTYAVSSDYRLKNITGPITGTEAKNFVMALQPKQGSWKADGAPFAGFVAHEFQTVSPTSVVGEKDAVDENGTPVMQAMQASSPEVMANLIAHIQNLETRLAALEA